jgi:hypothetical protein
MKPPRWYHFPLYIWALPVTLIGVLAAIIYVPEEIRWHDGCLEIVPKWILFDPGAQTLGWIVFYCHHNAMCCDEGLRVHERVHVWQNLKGSIFFAGAYLCQFLWFYLFAVPVDPVGEARWFRAYMAITFERIAYAIQNDYLAGNRPAAWGSL